MILRLKELREKNNQSLQDIANLLHISKPYYWQIENGKRNLYYKMAVRIANIYKKKPDDIFYDYFKDE